MASPVDMQRWFGDADPRTQEALDRRKQYLGQALDYGRGDLGAAMPVPAQAGALARPRPQPQMGFGVGAFDPSTATPAAMQPAPPPSQPAAPALPPEQAAQPAPQPAPAVPQSQPAPPAAAAAPVPQPSPAAPAPQTQVNDLRGPERMQQRAQANTAAAEDPTVQYQQSMAANRRQAAQDRLGGATSTMSQVARGPVARPRPTPQTAQPAAPIPQAMQETPAGPPPAAMGGPPPGSPLARILAAQGQAQAASPAGQQIELEPEGLRASMGPMRASNAPGLQGQGYPQLQNSTPFSFSASASRGPMRAADAQGLRPGARFPGRPRPKPMTKPGRMAAGGRLTKEIPPRAGRVGGATRETPAAGTTRRSGQSSGGAGRAAGAARAVGRTSPQAPEPGGTQSGKSNRALARGNRTLQRGRPGKEPGGTTAQPPGRERPVPQFGRRRRVAVRR